MNLGKSDDAVGKWYHDRIESVEGDGQTWKGMKKLREKNEWWLSNHEMHSCRAEGPYCGSQGFAVRYAIAFTPRGGQRIEMSEVGVYTVRNGKIIREEYLYAG
ncbi:MAG TPA: nuclear transport factor 2 family protein [Phycisphaerales bacterium]|nr:nuclear transport factor 2 family protein [Phycisphaerales bacterium]HMP38474.1 nuclear transport factor 2 family protein [Phycisphaerales bacterium]